MQARCGRRRPISKSRWRPTRTRPRPSASRRSPRPGSTGCRSASRRSTPRRCGFSAGGTTATRRSRRSVWRATPSPRYSFDLIYARPGPELSRRGKPELDEALALAGEHLSLYQLTIEPGTAFGNRATRGETLAADEETAAALFELTQDRLGTAGLPAYEISNHARPGAECRHNLAYWRYQDYLGIGPGAHGRVTREGGKIATAQLRQPEAWLAAVESAGTAIDEEIPIARDSAVEEMVMMGLRLVEGISRPRLEALADADVETLFGPRLPRLIEGGFLTLDSERLAATEAGSRVLNAVLAALFA